MLPALASICATHACFRVLSPKPKRLSDVKDVYPKLKMTGRRRNMRKHVVVTGGSGLVGSAIIRQLAEKGSYSVTSFDTRNPDESLKVKNVDYRLCDITSSADTIATLLENTDAVIHTAGVVCLSDNPNLLHNVHVVGTQNMIRASRLAGVQVFVFTSSSGAVTSPYVKGPQLNVPGNYHPDDSYHWPTHYSRTKYVAEKHVLKGNEEGFRTCAIRMPGVYGVFGDGTPDPILIGPLVSGLMSHVPTIGSSNGEPVLIDFCYVENAAHAHVLAMEALFENRKGVSGFSFNVTNGKHSATDTMTIWNTFLKLTQADTDAPRLLRPISFYLMYALGLMLEALYWYCDGLVPWPRHLLWNVTRCSIGYTATSITLDISKTEELLGYAPLYDTVQSFHHIIERSNGKENRSAAPPRRQNKRSRSSNARTRHKGGKQSTNPSMNQTATRTVFDCFYAFFFAFALWGNVSVDLWMGLDIDLLGTGFAFHNTVYEAGKAFDPLFIENSPYMKYSALVSALLFAPFYLLAVPQLMKGNGFGTKGSFRRNFAYVYAVGMAANMGIVLYMEFYEYFSGSSLAPSLGFYWIPCGAYFVVPLVLLARLIREDGYLTESAEKDATGAIAWGIPNLSGRVVERIFDRLSGPGMTGWESILTGISLVGTCYIANRTAADTWSPAQHRTSIFLAFIDGSAAVQCTTGTSKRWYHPKGRLPLYLFGVMVCEIVSQCIVVGLVFCDGLPNAFSFAAKTSAWFLLCMVMIRFVPLHAQRPLSVLCMLGSVALLNSCLIPDIPGLEWITVVLPTKYLVSHLTRHEPYIDC